MVTLLKLVKLTPYPEPLLVMAYPFPSNMILLAFIIKQVPVVLMLLLTLVLELTVPHASPTGTEAAM